MNNGDSLSESTLSEEFAVASSADRMSEINIGIARKIKARRRALGMTQKNLADQIGVRFQQISKYESGLNVVDAGRLGLIAEVLKVDLNYFYPNYTGQAVLPENVPVDLEKAVKAWPELSPRARTHLSSAARAAEFL